MALEREVNLRHSLQGAELEAVFTTAHTHPRPRGWERSRSSGGGDPSSLLPISLFPWGNLNGFTPRVQRAQSEAAQMTESTDRNLFVSTGLQFRRCRLFSTSIHLGPTGGPQDCHSQYQSAKRSSETSPAGAEQMLVLQDLMRGSSSQDPGHRC